MTLLDGGEGEKPRFEDVIDPYQRRAAEFLTSRPAGGLLLDPGFGKTAVALRTYVALRRAGKVRRALVVAPRYPAYSVWSRASPTSEVEKWAEFEALEVALLHGPRKAEALARDADLYVINPEGLAWLVAQRQRPRFDLLIVDESTKFKRTNTQRFKHLRKLLRGAARRWILTGTPAPRSLEDLFGQMYVLDEGATLGRYVTHFRHRYFYPTGFGGYEWRPKAGAEAEIYERLRPLVLRLEGRESADLPPLVERDVWLELPDAARRAYDEVERELFTALDEGEVIAANAAAASTKCRQIAGGGVYLDERRQRWEHLHRVKDEAVGEIVEELQGQPALVAYQFKHELERLRARFGRDVPHLGSGVTPRQAARIEVAWNTGDLPVLLAHPASVAHGLNLQATGRAVIWHSVTWDLEHYVQLIRRLWRRGQQHRVVNHRLLMRGTVDEAIRRALGRKGRTEKALLNALLEYRRSSL